MKFFVFDNDIQRHAIKGAQQIAVRRLEPVDGF